MTRVVENIKMQRNREKCACIQRRKQKEQHTRPHTENNALHRAQRRKQKGHHKENYNDTALPLFGSLRCFTAMFTMTALLVRFSSISLKTEKIAFRILALVYFLSPSFHDVLSIEPLLLACTALANYAFAFIHCAHLQSLAAKALPSLWRTMRTMKLWDSEKKCRKKS